VTEPMSLALKAQVKQPSNEFLIFTHSSRSRFLSLCIFSIYLVIFLMFSRFLIMRIEHFDSLPGLLLESPRAKWMFYATAITGWLMTLGIFFYLIWMVIDFWGLQVWISPTRVVVRNTLVGSFLSRITGVGELDMERLQRVKGTAAATFLIGDAKRLRVSPVDRLEVLIAKLIEYAESASFEI